MLTCLGRGNSWQRRSFSSSGFCIQLIWSSTELQMGVSRRETDLLSSSLNALQDWRRDFRVFTMSCIVLIAGAMIWIELISVPKRFNLQETPRFYEYWFWFGCNVFVRRRIFVSFFNIGHKSTSDSSRPWLIQSDFDRLDSSRSSWNLYETHQKTQPPITHLSNNDFFLPFRLLTDRSNGFPLPLLLTRPFYRLCRNTHYLRLTSFPWEVFDSFFRKRVKPFLEDILSKSYW